MFLVIADWNKEFHPNRVNETETESEAVTLVDKLINDMPSGLEAPNAFYVSHPGVEERYIIVNPDTKTITVDLAGKANDISIRTMAALRQKRDGFLTDTDWWGSSDNTMSDAQIAYRRALRNYPATYTADNTAAWPTKP